ncbi:MAG: DUF3800 domain-containing protein [Gammaproteobacteria bacterium]|nr:DUF3800 domain-containing protein [Gammaproteobacteria bacterium]MCY4278468.1 DUF3800 domain-containing protein [Gammaproteobacteria bacterium]
MTYIAYLDEFGHVGPYIAREDPKHNDSPVFGLAGLIIPIEKARGFGTWFFQRKCELLDFEIRQSGKHPSIWEKKGSSLYTTKNVVRYPELRRTTFRLLSKIENVGGRIFYVGIRKTADPGTHDANSLYSSILAEAIRRLDLFCREDHSPAEYFLLALDQHPLRAELLTEAAREMYGGETPSRRLIEPPFQLESHRYQTIQAADWIAGLIGRLGTIWKEPDAWPENVIFRRYFEHRLIRLQSRSGIR